MKKRKGILEEIISKAIHSDCQSDYSIIYREFDIAKEVNLFDFLRMSNNFETVPASRIILVKKGNEVLFKTSRKDLLRMIN